MKPGPGNENGQIIPLMIAYVLVALTLAIVVIDITAVHLQRNRLYGVADASALDAADALDRQRFYSRATDPPPTTAPAPPPADDTSPDAAAPPASTSPPVPISDQTVRSSVAAFLRRAGPESRLSGLAMAPPTGTADGLTAEVTLRCQARILLFSFVTVRWRDGVPIRVTARARTAGT